MAYCGMDVLRVCVCVQKWVHIKNFFALGLRKKGGISDFTKKFCETQKTVFKIWNFENFKVFGKIGYAKIKEVLYIGLI